MRGSYARTLVELAIATQIPVRAWLQEDDRTIITAIEVVETQAREIQKGRDS